MNIHIIMDETGDTRHFFDCRDPKALAGAERRFRELTSRGFRAVALARGGAPSLLVREFDPTAEQTLFIPQLHGG
jgi:hypothetical protein